MTRRTFLDAALSAGVAGLLSTTLNLSGLTPATPARPDRRARKRKLIVVVFGGGTRSSESMEDPEHRFIPRLWNEMVPYGTLFTNLRVQGKVVHPNCTASILTGHAEYEDNDWSRPVAHPSIFEIYRKTRGAPDTAAWAFVYASILARTAESLAPSYGPEFAANVVEPPTIPRDAAEAMAERMQRASASGSSAKEMAAAQECAVIARTNSRIALSGLRSDAARAFVQARYAAWKTAAGTTSHDAFLTELAIASMRTFAPDVMAVAYGEIDCAHYGSWSRYVEAIRRTDELTWRVWQAVQDVVAYRRRTLMLILPDHGRELEREGGPGFIHHSNFYTDQDADEGCRKTWMLALGPGIAVGRRVDEPIPAPAAAATGLAYLGLAASPGAAASVLPLMRQKHGRRPIQHGGQH